MKTLSTIAIILAIVAVITYVVDMYLLIKHCNAGYEGSNDKWDSEHFEKLHYKLAPISLAAVVISAFMLALICS